MGSLPPSPSVLAAATTRRASTARRACRRGRKHASRGGAALGGLVCSTLLLATLLVAAGRGWCGLTPGRALLLGSLRVAEDALQGLGGLQLVAAASILCNVLTRSDA